MRRRGNLYGMPSVSTRPALRDRVRSPATRSRFLISAFLIGGLGLAACGGSARALEPAVTMAPMADMPMQVQAAPVVVQQAYRFAAANPALMKQIPCYCGCGAIGHTSNYACYVSGMLETAKLAFDTHALACGICVDITQDVMRLSGQGKSPGDIRAYVDQTYSKFGPSNMR